MASELSTLGKRKTNIFNPRHLLKINIPKTMISPPSITANSVTGSIIAVKMPKTKDKMQIPMGLQPPLGGPRRGPLPIFSPPEILFHIYYAKVPAFVQRYVLLILRQIGFLNYIFQQTAQMRDFVDI